MKPRKVRLNSGRYTPRLAIKDKRETIINNCLEPQEEWDNWIDRRDGMRGYDDRTRIRHPFMCFADAFNVKRWNGKLKRLLKRRKRMKRVRKRE